MRRGTLTTALAAITLLASACTPTSVGGDLGPQRPEPSQAATGPVIATLEENGTTLELHDEGENCLAVEIVHEGLQSTVERGCFDSWNSLRQTEPCGWLTEPSEETPWDCDVELPSVLYGRVANPDVGYVCVGQFDFGDSGPSHGVIGARILPRDDNGYVFTIANPGESYHAHFLSTGGHRVGDPPLDAPSGPIYEFCEALAGVEDQEELYHVDLAVAFDESLYNRDVTAWFHSGLDQQGVLSSVIEPGQRMTMPVRITRSADSFSVEIEINGEPTMGLQLSWPKEVREILVSGEPCNGLTTVNVDIGAGVLEGTIGSVTSSFAGTECSVGSKEN